MTYVAEVVTVAWDYTMADINRLSRIAARRHGLSYRLDLSEREETAWHGVVEELFVSPEFPGEYRLIAAGMRALDRLVSEERHHHGATLVGISWSRSDFDNGFQAIESGRSSYDPSDQKAHAPNFMKYWLPPRRQTEWDDGFSDHLLDLLMLPDALATLTQEQYEAIVTLAAFDNVVGEAAAALGLKYHGFYYRVQAARKQIIAYWFEDDEQPVKRKAGETCRSGHSRAEHGVRQPSGVWSCRACKQSWRNRNSRELNDRQNEARAAARASAA